MSTVGWLVVGVLVFLVSFGRCESSLLICAIILAGFAMSPTTKQIRLASWSVKKLMLEKGPPKWVKPWYLRGTSL